MIHENFSKYLKEARISQNLTQSTVANAVNISRASYINYEHGRTTPSTETMYKLSEILKTDLINAYFQSLILSIIHDYPSTINHNEYLALIDLYAKVPNNTRLLLLDYIENIILNREEVR